MSFPTPTNGIGVPLVVTVTGSGLVKLGSQLAKSTTTQNTGSGSQFAAWFSGSTPGGADFSATPGAGTGAAGATPGGNQYGLTLSLSATGGFATTCQLSLVASDTQGNTESATGTYLCYNDPAFTGFNPKTASTGFPVPTHTDGRVASVSLSGGLITALAVGQAIVEIQVPFAGNTEGSFAAINSGDSVGSEVRQMDYAQIVVQVVP